MCGCQYLSWSPPRFSLYIWVLLCWVHIYIYNVYVFLMDSSLQYYEVSFCVSFYHFCFEVYFVWYQYFYPSFFSCVFSWSIFFQSFTFCLYRSFVLRWVSCGQYMYGSCFLIHLATLCFLSINIFWMSIQLGLWSEHKFIYSQKHLVHATVCLRERKMSEEALLL